MESLEIWLELGVGGLEVCLSKFSGALKNYWGNSKTTNPTKLPVSKINSAK